MTPKGLVEADLVKLRDALAQETLLQAIEATEKVVKELAEKLK